MSLELANVKEQSTDVRMTYCNKLGVFFFFFFITTIKDFAYCIAISTKWKSTTLVRFFTIRITNVYFQIVHWLTQKIYLLNKISI